MALRRLGAPTSLAFPAQTHNVIAVALMLACVTLCASIFQQNVTQPMLLPQWRMETMDDSKRLSPVRAVNTLTHRELC